MLPTRACLAWHFRHLSLRWQLLRRLRRMDCLNPDAPCWGIARLREHIRDHKRFPPGGVKVGAR